jgi:hypothetical protein
MEERSFLQAPSTDIVCIIRDIPNDDEVKTGTRCATSSGNTNDLPVL